MITDKNVFLGEIFYCQLTNTWVRKCVQRNYIPALVITLVQDAQMSTRPINGCDLKGAGLSNFNLPLKSQRRPVVIF